MAIWTRHWPDWSVTKGPIGTRAVNKRKRSRRISALSGFWKSGASAYGDGSTVLLIPSFINGSQILNLAPDYSFADYLAAAGHRVLLLDWGPVDSARAKEGLAEQITDFVLPLVKSIGATGTSGRLLPWRVARNGGGAIGPCKKRNDDSIALELRRI